MIIDEQAGGETSEMDKLISHMADDGEEPRVQILGASEVYMNDPRQRRLEELQTTQKILKPVTSF